MARLYSIGIKPDWWKLEQQPSDAAWAAVSREIEAGDPLCRGVVLLGLEAPADQLAAAFRIAARCDRVKGFAVGRTIFADAAKAWLGGGMDDAAAVDDMANRFATLVAAWEEARGQAA
jgi:5-dehydro-2-deoxygluconokinase